MTITPALIDRLLKDQHNKCAACHRTFDQHPYHVHHAIFPKGQTNYKKYRKWLDMSENLMLVCWICHQDHGRLTNNFRRDMFWSFKIDNGWDMQGWYDSIPMADKSYQFIYLEGSDNGKENLDKS